MKNEGLLSATFHTIICFWQKNGIFIYLFIFIEEETIPTKHIALDIPIAPIQAAPCLDVPSLLFKAHLLTFNCIGDFFIILSYKCKVNNLNVLVMIGRATFQKASY